MNKVAIYVRVSTTSQAEEGYSIDEQIDKLSSYCKIKDWTVYDVYKDGGFSGGNIERPAMERLISDAKRKRFDTVLVYKLDRLSRSQKDTLFLIEEVFLKNNISFLSLNESFDTSTPFGKAMIGILSVFAQLEREQIKERLMLGKVGRAKSGKPMMFSSISFGYTYDKHAKELHINQAEAVIVKKIFSEYLSGRSLTNLRDYLNDNGFTRNGRYWDYQGLKRIMKNPVYIGMIRYNGVIYPGNHQAIIDAETFDKTQIELKKRQLQAAELQNNPRPFRAKYMLSGLLRCGYCSAPLTVVLSGKTKSGSRNIFYECYNRHPKIKKGRTIYNDGKKCNSGTYNKSYLEECILNEIRLLQLNPERIDDIYDVQPTIDIDGIENQIATLNKKLDKLNDLYLNDMVSMDVLKKQTHTLRQQKKILEHELENNNVEIIKNSKRIFKETLNISDVTKLDYNIQKNIVNTLIKGIVVKNGEITIQWRI
ncbi:TPA: recombinase family protein [Streptococcus suis]|nr:recombinase family protein [Streptococcus suis]